MEDVTIPEFFAKKNIFVTGGSGFIGKAVIEKLLRSCPDLNKIYVLIRSKKNEKPQQRINTILNNGLFDTIRSSNPGLLDKVIPITGDITELQLGLNEEDKKLVLQSEIVIHMAASVRFDDPLKKAIIMNARGTREIMELMLQMPNLIVGVHVSTAYSNSNREVIEEKMYREHGDWKEAIRFAENFQDDYQLACLTKKCLGEMGNTYVYAKHLAENIAEDYSSRLPLVIYRPGVVLSTWQEPIPGWNDNLNGPASLCIAIGTGFLRCILLDEQKVIDEMPVDLVARGLLIATWKKGTNKDTDDLPIYNCTMKDLVQYTYIEFRAMSFRVLENYSFKNVLWHPFCYFTKHQTCYRVLFFIFNVLVAVVVDKVLQTLGKKPLLGKLTRKTYYANITVAPFALKHWNFENRNFSNLNNVLKSADRNDFLIHVQGWDFYDSIKNNIIGASKFVFNEDVDYEKQRIITKRLKYLHYTLKYLLWASLLYFLLLPKVFNIYKNL